MVAKRRPQPRQHQPRTLRRSQWLRRTRGLGPPTHRRRRPATAPRSPRSPTATPVLRPSGARELAMPGARQGHPPMASSSHPIARCASMCRSAMRVRTVRPTRSMRQTATSSRIMPSSAPHTNGRTPLLHSVAERMQHGFVRCPQRGVVRKLAPLPNFGAAKQKTRVFGARKFEKAHFISVSPRCETECIVSMYGNPQDAHYGVFLENPRHVHTSC
jgi:hypothetical protein